jgi:hypothetical protein
MRASSVDEAESVSQAHPQQDVCDDAESGGECGDATHSVALIHPALYSLGKRVFMDDGPSDSVQSKLKINPEAPSWTKRGMYYWFES